MASVGPATATRQVVPRRCPVACPVPVGLVAIDPAWIGLASIGREQGDPVPDVLA
ncbi:MAG: hypothetical protein K1X74_06835 [Pirellulales bacterium]|nr:hypothetical protein [Pirellulales bacterium]